jgi:acyl carrier protein
MTMTCPTPPAGDPYDIVVRDALARHLHLSRDDVRSTHRLREDLGLDALDLSMIALRLERVARREFPLAVLDLVHTVDQLVSLVRAWATARGGSRLVAV